MSYIFGSCEKFDPLFEIAPYSTFDDNNDFGEESTFGASCNFGVGNHFCERTTFAPRCTFGGHNIFGSDVEFGFGATFGEYCYIGDHSTIGDRATFGYHNRVGNDVVIGTHAQLGESFSHGERLTIEGVKAIALMNMRNVAGSGRDILIIVHTEGIKIRAGSFVGSLGEFSLQAGEEGNLRCALVVTAAAKALAEDVEQSSETGGW